MQLFDYTNIHLSHQMVSRWTAFIIVCTVLLHSGLSCKLYITRLCCLYCFDSAVRKRAFDYIAASKPSTANNNNHEQQHNDTNLPTVHNIDTPSSMTSSSIPSTSLDPVHNPAEVVAQYNVDYVAALLTTLARVECNNRELCSKLNIAEEKQTEMNKEIHSLRHTCKEQESAYHDIQSNLAATEQENITHQRFIAQQNAALGDAKASLVSQEYKLKEMDKENKMLLDYIDDMNNKHKSKYILLPSLSLNDHTHYTMYSILLHATILIACLLCLTFILWVCIYHCYF